MFLGEPPVLKEHLFIKDQKMSTCLKMKRISERSSNAKYQCAKVNAVVKNGKIISISSLD
jgi:hypothetical protein